MVRLVSLVCSGLAAVGLGGDAGPELEAAEIRSGRPSARIDALMAEHASNDAPGAAVLVVRGEEVVHAAGYGLANLATGERITPRTVFGIGAMTMPFTSLAVLMLAEQRLIHLDDSVSRYVPELKRRFGTAITIRQLLNHTSGLPDYYASMDSLFPKVKVRSRYGNEVKRLTMPTNADGADALYQWGAPEFPPGSDFRYHHCGYEMLALVIERVTDQRYADVLAEKVFDRLGMTATFVADGAAGVIVHRAYDYHPEEDGYARSDYRRMMYMMGAQGIHSSLEDLSRWVRALDSDHLVPEEFASEVYAPSALADGRRFDYGLGWRIGVHAGHRRVFHEGDRFGFRSVIARHPELGVTVVILANRDDCDPLRLVDSIVDCYLPAADGGERNP